jgi:geranylgeranyl diphosphate synthase, type II
MNKTSLSFAVAGTCRKREKCVHSQYMATRAFSPHQVSSRLAIVSKNQGASRSSVPGGSGFERQSTENLKEAFYDSMPLPSALDPGFEDALRHVLANPGSMVRPRMVLRVAAAYGLDEESAHNVAFALEYFHTASLIFDDLPCMDNAHERRGVACVHVEHGESSAILTALALINRAYALVWRAVSACPSDARCEVMAYIEERLGVEGLLNGQSLDLHYSSLPQTGETTERIALGKTVSLIRLTLVLPAMLGGAAAREIQLLERIALCWGLGYQIVDDLKDVFQSEMESGKTAARDELLGRPNIAGAIGICGAVERLERLMQIGDRTLGDLLMHRPALSFLSKLRSDLEIELRRVSDSALRGAQKKGSAGCPLGVVSESTEERIGNKRS